MLINETKINKTISASEFLPDAYSFNCRKDRPDNEGGGVMIAAHKDLDISEIELCDNEAEIVSAKIILKGHDPVIISSFYRTPSKQGAESIEQIEELDKILNFIGDKHDTDSSTVILGWDLNTPNIEYTTQSLEILLIK